MGFPFDAALHFQNPRFLVSVALPARQRLHFFPVCGGNNPRNAAALRRRWQKGAPIRRNARVELPALLLTPLTVEWTKPPRSRNHPWRKLRRIWLVCRVEARPFSMVRPYRKRRGLGKCEANRILMNCGAGEVDSTGFTNTEIDKTFVIQNLFQELRKPGLPQEIFLNYSLDSNLSPKRRSPPVEAVDNHLQAIENNRKSLLRPMAP